MTNSVTPPIICSICRKSVELETSKTDERGEAIHEECYVQVVTRRPPSSESQSPTQS